jgi:hypothetical protein
MSVSLGGLGPPGGQPGESATDQASSLTSDPPTYGL